MSEKVEKIHVLKVEKLYPNSVLPYKPKTNTDSGFDLIAHNVTKIYSHNGSNSERLLEGDALKARFPENGVVELQQGERALVGTGLRMTIGPGYELQVRPRSGLALKQGLTVLNTPGTIDESFRNEVGVIILNTSRQSQRFKLGDPIAQIVPMKIELLEIIEEELELKTERGLDGFGSTDKFGRDFLANVTNPLGGDVDIKVGPFNFI